MSNGKKKGAKNERELCKWFQSWSGYEFSRVPASGGLRWKNTENITGDIICSDDRYSRRFAFSVETKFHKDINFEHLILGNTKNKVLEFWKQAEEDGERGNKTPLLFMRYNGMPKNTWFVVIDANTYKHAYSFGLKDAENIIFNIFSPKHNLYVLNSSDMLKVNFKELSIKLKKLRRKNGKN